MGEINVARLVALRGKRVLPILKWMRVNAPRFVDECGEVNATAMAEAWDVECSTGEATMSEHHPAWDVAAEVAGEYEGR